MRTISNSPPRTRPTIHRKVIIEFSGDFSFRNKRKLEVVQGRNRKGIRYLGFGQLAECLVLAISRTR
jgi:hypothetical protein